MRFAAAGAKLQFTPTNFSGGGGQGIGAAASMATLNKTFGAVRARSPKYGNISKTAMSAHNYMWRAAETAKANVMRAGIGAQATVAAAKAQADAAKAAAAKRSQGSMIGGALGAVAKIGIGLLSDERCKNNIQPLEDALETLRKLKPVTFYYNEEYTGWPERLNYGFIAQEYAMTMPDQTFFDHDLDRMCIDTNQLIAVLVKGMQELSDKVTELEAKLS